MNRMRLLALVCLLLSSAASAREQPDLYVILKKPAYRVTFDALVGGRRTVPKWLATFSRTGDGAVSPGREVQLGATRYQLNDVCQTHSCSRSRFAVLFAPHGQKAWGLLRQVDANGEVNERFFGDPDDEKAAALRAAFEE